MLNTNFGIVIANIFHICQELEQMRRVNSRKEEEVLRRHAIEKKRLPRIQKTEMKTRAAMFKQSLRISAVMSPEHERDKIRKFDEQEKKRVKGEQLRQELKHKKQWDDLQAKNEAALRELEQLQVGVVECRIEKNARIIISSLTHMLSIVILMGWYDIFMLM